MISHLKYWAMGATFAAVYKITEKVNLFSRCGWAQVVQMMILVRSFLKDRLFCALPLYHSAGGGIGVDLMIVSGATFIITRKFSAKRCVPFPCLVLVEAVVV